MPRVRTFIAIDVGETIRKKLVQLQRSLRDDGAEAKWVEAENLHLTLLFLGEVDIVEVPAVCNAVLTGVKKHKRFTMAIEKTGCFPNIRRPRVLWAGVGTGADRVAALHDDLEEPLLDLGCYRREERKYTPHLTIGRVKGEKNKADLGAIISQYAEWEAGEVAVNELHVMSSELTPSGPIYTILSRARLK